MLPAVWVLWSGDTWWLADYQLLQDLWGPPSLVLFRSDGQPDLWGWQQCHPLHWVLRQSTWRNTVQCERRGRRGDCRWLGGGRRCGAGSLAMLLCADEEEAAASHKGGPCSTQAVQRAVRPVSVKDLPVCRLQPSCRCTRRRYVVRTLMHSTTDLWYCTYGTQEMWAQSSGYTINYIWM